MREFRIAAGDSVLFCHQCAKDVIPELSKAGPHVKASCPDCGTFIKFVKQAGNEKSLLGVVLNILPRLGARERQEIREALDARN